MEVIVFPSLHRAWPSPSEPWQHFAPLLTQFGCFLQPCAFINLPGVCVIAECDKLSLFISRMEGGTKYLYWVCFLPNVDWTVAVAVKQFTTYSNAI